MQSRNPVRVLRYVKMNWFYDYNENIEELMSDIIAAI